MDFFKNRLVQKFNSRLVKDFYGRLVKGERSLIISAIVIVCFVPLTVYGGIKVFNYPGRCAICHSMKPEYFTWQASVHGEAQVVCLSCHSTPGIKNLARQKLAGFEEVFLTVTGSYTTPIKIFDTVKDEACERCHDMSKRETARAGAQNLHVPHDVHKKARVACSKCHSGMAHGHIADRKVTYETDFTKWTPELGEAMMSDPREVGLQMDTCIRCHELRNVTKKCSTCHPAGKQPPSHENADFKNKAHGQMARQSLEECDSCHSYMSSEPVDLFKKQESFKEFLNQQKADQLKAQEASLLIPYARTNTFCRDCHAKRPSSHTGSFWEAHGAKGKQDRSCEVCHDNNVQTGPSGGKATRATGETVTLVSCSNCHPSTHSRSIAWQKGYHPGYVLPNPLKLTRSCYTCHEEKRCGRCHGVLK